jgi:hypothetical protein
MKTKLAILKHVCSSGCFWREFVNVAWGVLRLRVEETASRYVDEVR